MSHVRRKAGPRKRHWCFISFLDSLPDTYDKKVVRYVIYQREVCPESKKQHFQGYIEFYDNTRVGQAKAVLGECHLECRRGSRTEAREYCRKVETAVPDSQFEFGDWREDISRKRKLSDMLKTDMTLDDLIAEAPHLYVMYYRGLHKLYSRRLAKAAKVFREVTVTVLIGPTGCGKTKKATSGDDWYIIPCSEKTWFDNYEGEKTLVIDDFYGGIKYSSLLRILDGHCLQVPFKGGFVYAFWTKVIITSNAEPSTWYKFGYPEALERRLTEDGSKIVYMSMCSSLFV